MRVRVYIHCEAVMPVLVDMEEGEMPDEAIQGFIDSENFFNDFRENCEFSEPTVIDHEIVER